MDPRYLMLCMFGRHRRDGRKASYSPVGIVQSVCKGCGKPMVKIGGRWRIDQTGEHPD